MNVASLPGLLGQGLKVPLATGGTAVYANLDNAASTSALESVATAVNNALPWYASVHRGAGFASQVSTRMYEAARLQVARFVGARPDDSVIFVRNTTEALNLLAHALHLDPDSAVVTTAVEHHANLLPWRRAGRVIHLDVPASAAALLDQLGKVIAAESVTLVSTTGASNVTGEVFPIAQLAALAHRQGALFCVDAAQLAPHRAIDMAGDDIDVLALSGHKLYAPFGAGVLVVRRGILDACEPMLVGGGAVDLVTLDDVVWTSMPDRHEAGSPNVIGAVALGAATAALTAVGMDRIAEHERELLAMTVDGLINIPAIRQLRLWDGPDVDRLGTYAFTVEGLPHALIAAVLAAEWGIGVRHGCFCAHPYLTHLLGVPQAEAEWLRAELTDGRHPLMPGATRASFGLGTTVAEVERFTTAMRALVTEGPQLSYSRSPTTGDYTVDNDPRRWPQIPGLPDLDEIGGEGAGCGQL